MPVSGTCDSVLLQHVQLLDLFVLKEGVANGALQAAAGSKTESATHYGAPRRSERAITNLTELGISGDDKFSGAWKGDIQVNTNS